MKASQSVIDIWKRFDDFPMETLTKAWYSQIASVNKQRTVDLMKLHREEYGTSGNCFDLAIWLINEFRENKLQAYAVFTPHFHVAVVVIDDEGYKYLCDLGDQWVQPILIDREHEEYTEEFVEGFFPGAQIKLTTQLENLIVTYRRPSGKESNQSFNLTPVSDSELIAAGEKTQRNITSPLVEKRLFMDDQVGHWEFDNYKSFISRNTGREIEDQLSGIEEWANRISRVSGINEAVVLRALEVYSR
ncbi:hypothetical protein J1TS1_37470 [Shouchella clausii]|uniref:Uncharacterized protein n=2 Tax=Shouchella TaxID=2893057 RepID=Q5WGK4_SHOC1|nr:hypothetical protein [Shouchella clausii]BAD64501.1 hypothetical protein ABC1966 [Shouchella clausii KSM-K16]GIN09602.1 hypothetical protein J1TS1_37470 [Shouchella clausii]